MVPPGMSIARRLIDAWVERARVTVDARTGEVVELLQALIRNRCVNDGEVDSGDESSERRRAVGATSARSASRSSASIIPTRRSRASLVARIEGSDPDAPTVAFMGHTDVVPVSEESWTRDPFGGELVDGPAGWRCGDGARSTC